MIIQREMSPWRMNTKRYLTLLQITQKLYEENKITRKQKKEIEEKLDFLFKKNYWKLNPNLKDPLLAKVVIGMFNTFQIL